MSTFQNSTSTKSQAVNFRTRYLVLCSIIQISRSCPKQMGCTQNRSNIIYISIWDVSMVLSTWAASFGTRCLVILSVSMESSRKTRSCLRWAWRRNQSLGDLYIGLKALRDRAETAYHLPHKIPSDEPSPIYWKQFIEWRSRSASSSLGPNVEVTTRRRYGMEDGMNGRDWKFHPMLRLLCCRKDESRS